MFFNVYLFLWETETECEWGEGQRERERHRIWSRLQAPSCQPRAPHGAPTLEPQNHDLSRSQTLNQLSHPGAPTAFLGTANWSYNLRKPPLDTHKRMSKRGKCLSTIIWFWGSFERVSKTPRNPWTTHRKPLPQSDHMWAQAWARDRIYGFLIGLRSHMLS